MLIKLCSGYNSHMVCFLLLRQTWMFWALVFFDQTGLDWFHFLQRLECGWAFGHNHQTLPWGYSVMSPQCQLLGFTVWLCGIHWGTPVWGSFMAKSAPFFPCSTLFLADDFHFWAPLPSLHWLFFSQSTLLHLVIEFLFSSFISGPL